MKVCHSVYLDRHHDSCSAQTALRHSNGCRNVFVRIVQGLRRELMRSTDG